MPNKNQGPKESVLRLAASHIEITCPMRDYTLCTRHLPDGVFHLNAMLFCIPDQFPYVMEDSTVSDSKRIMSAMF